ncbi:MAG TPA: transcription elongation factor GreA [Tepidiformaceae bacterium]|jgi:transcription elongation factor GreA|nr:transcription elongation factor GreA [Tepidiformaceae bacterium]
MTEESQSGIATQVTLGEALREYLQGLKPEARAAQENYVRKYVEHAGESTSIASLTGSRVESYAEAQIRSADPNAPERVAALKAWFQYLKKKGYAGQNFGIHIRVRRVAGRNSGQQVRIEQTPIEMTADGLEARKKELQDLKATRPAIVEAIALAREDKDFRENAPLQAAREQLGMTDGRIKQLESDLKRAVVVERTSEDISSMGSTVTVTRIDTDKQATFTLVGGREANATEKKISIESPVGRELLGRRVGEQVSVVVPSGVVQYRVDEIKHSS